MTAALCRKRSNPLRSGQPRTWAWGIVYALGRVNFLGDKSFSPYMTTADLCAAFEAGQSTLRLLHDLVPKAVRIAVAAGPSALVESRMGAVT
jgi:uncharacterized protein DUF6398